MENFSFILSLVAAVGWITTSAKVARLERMMKEAGIGKQRKDSLKDVLEKNIGQKGKIEFERGQVIGDISEKSCIILDVDEEWLLVKEPKKAILKLVRIDAVKTIQFF